MWSFNRVFNLYNFLVLIYVKVSLFIAVILALALGILVTGGLHEDGLADSCDGIFGGKNIKSRLSIMTDSNIGTYGVLSLIIIFSLRVFILSEFEVNLSGFISFISIAATSRLSMLFILFYLPPAKKSGLGFNAKIKNYKSLVIACIISFLLLAPKPGDMIINVMKGKQLTNMRTQGTDENVVLTPVRQMSIAEQLSMLNTDEALEITPKSLRLRKAILNPTDRKKNEKSGTPL